MSFLDGLSSGLFGSDQDERYGGGGRSEQLAKTGGLSGIQDFGHDMKRWFGKKKNTNSTVASDTFAALTRQQWADFQRDIVPYENKLIEFSNSTTAAVDSMKRGIETVGSTFERQADATTGRMRALGLELNADEQQAAQRSTGLAQATAEVHAANSAGAQTRALQQALLGNPTPQAGDLR